MTPMIEFRGSSRSKGTKVGGDVKLELDKDPSESATLDVTESAMVEEILGGKVYIDHRAVAKYIRSLMVTTWSSDEPGPFELKLTSDDSGKVLVNGGAVEKVVYSTTHQNQLTVV